MSIFRSAIAAGLFAIAVVAAPAAHADDLQTIKEAGQIRVGLSAEYPPFNFVDANNQIVGFDVEIGQEIARRMGMKDAIVTTAWDGILAGLLAKKFDTIIGSMTITPEREKVVDFVGPYYRDGRGIFVKEGSDIQTLDQLKGKKLGVTLGETHEKWAREKGGWDVVTYKGLPALLIELNAGRVDAIVVDSIPVAIAAKETGQQVRKLNTPDIEGGDVGIGIAIRKNNPELKAAMQKALNEMMADGTYEKISMKWIGRDIR